MISTLAAGPPSPPTSPHMDIAAKQDGLQWGHTSNADYTAPPLQLPPAKEDSATTFVQHNSDSQVRPLLRSIKSFPYSLGPSSRLQNNSFQDDTNGSSADFKEHVLSQGPQPTATADLLEPTYGGSAPASPVERLTPRSQEAGATGGQGETQADDEEMDLEGGDQEEEAEQRPMTAAELRAHKRKMKRFRLTHNQTRFLMSEFARQPHPDAAHRERLSREIPGLSPRQVQVWFQNRRAKLKRLTTDDRERMMRSRALPADFDMMQALRAPFGAPTPASGTPEASPSGINTFNNPDAVRPLTLDTLRRVPDYDHFSQNFTSPSGMTSAIGSFNFTPPQSATDTISPSSAIGMSPFTFQPQESPRRQGYGLSLNTQAGFAVQNGQVARHHLHERFGRNVNEMAGSPLRSSISYSGLSADINGHSQPQQQIRSNSMSDHRHYTHERPSNPRSATFSSMSGSGPYGLGFTYPQLSTYQPADQITATTSATDMPSYSRSSAGLPTSSITYNGGNSYAHSFTPQYAQYTSQYTPQAFQAPFPTQASEEQERHRHLHNAITQVTAAQAGQSLFPSHLSAYSGEGDDGTGSEGGVPGGSVSFQ